MFRNQQIDWKFDFNFLFTNQNCHSYALVLVICTYVHKDQVSQVWLCGYYFLFSSYVYFYKYLSSIKPKTRSHNAMNTDSPQFFSKEMLKTIVFNMYYLVDKLLYHNVCMWFTDGLELLSNREPKNTRWSCYKYHLWMF